MKDTRRNFLKKSSLFAFSVSAFGIAACKKAEDPAETAMCRTTEDILGPFYRANAPLRSDLIIPGHTSTELEVHGHVYQNDCTTPLADAIVEFWQSDSEGNYDNGSDRFDYRGRQLSNQDGTYSFKTIIPGRYLNGNTYRPSHIHFRITAPAYRELVSQIYFKDDPFISTDPWASMPTASQRILEITTAQDGSESVHFPIYMSKI